MTIMIFDLPYDLESEIIARVPSKSLAKLQTTCKRWYVLFKDPTFVKKNNNLCKASNEVMLLIDHRVYSINVNSVDPSIVSTGKLTSLEDSKEVELSRIFHCNGLILCCTKDFESLVVWNPCTGETMSIKPSSSYRLNVRYAFGCGNSESSCPNYKILRFSNYYCKKSEQSIFDCEIFDFSSDSWRLLDGITWRILCSDNVVSLKGNAYWIHFDRKLSAESYSVLVSQRREEQLAVLYHDIGTSLTEITVWLSTKIDEGKEVSWSKLFVVNCDTYRLPRYPRVIMTSWVDEENKVVVSCIRDRDGRDYVYIVGERLQKHVHGECWIWPCLLSYVPSLGHIPKAKKDETL